MKVEIKGIDFGNKGALLMLQSIINEFEKRNRNCEFVVEVVSDYELRARYPLYIIFPPFPRRTAGVPIGPLVNLVPKKLRHCLGLTLPKEIDVVLDASGFAYSDQWGEVKARRRLGNFRKRYRSDTKLILLPQAFGPFDTVNLISTMRSIFDCCDLIFARDSQSLCAVKSIASKSVKDNIVRQCPDFTQTLQSAGAKNILPEELYDGVYLVVNHKVIEKGVMTEKDYIQWFCEAFEVIKNNGDAVFFLNHEGVKDRDIAEKIIKRLESSPPIIESNNPLELKKAIGCSKGGIASRFHAVVSSLCQGVPVGVLGWSHKYIELANDYGVQELVISREHEETGGEAASRLYRFLQDAYKMEGLASMKGGVEGRVGKMWDEVFEVIDEK